MSDSYYLGIDVGTGSARICLVDDSGEIKALATKDIKTWNDKADYYEQSTEDIWNAICYCCKQVMREAKIQPEQVKGIGCDATCSLAVLADDTDEPISVCGPDFTDHKRNVILWMDHRPVTQTERINATKHKLLQYVGGSMSIEMEIPKVLWLKENMPRDLFRRCHFYDLADVLTHIATGEKTRSFCSTVCKQAYVPVGVDGSIKGWQEDFLAAIGLQELAEDNFRRMGGVHGENGVMLSAGQLVGTLCEKSASELGLVSGIKIGSGVIDAYAGWIGTVGARVKPDCLGSDVIPEGFKTNDLEQAFHRLAAVAGTSTCHLVMSREPKFVPGIWGPYRDVVLENFWMAEGGQSATGSLLHHIVTTHTSYEKAKEAAMARKQNIYEYLNHRLEELAQESKASTISYLARHFFLVGDYHGNRSPIADPRMRGSVVGLSMDSSVDSLALMYYAALEFIALQTRHIIEALNTNGHTVTSIFMSGGQCRNNLLMTLIANATGYPVVIPRYIDAAVVLGAAILGAKAASANETGETEGLWGIIDRMSKPGDIVLPTKDKREKELLEVKYKIFLRMSKEQQEYRKMVDDVIFEWK
ncbi:FGGY family of carbohydrate kinase [Kalaharituber pfeilii]|nr:FGGY family of carbohydrate kinase [Kalaharituber pfeilii]